MSELAKKLSQGQLPLPGMMTAQEITDHFFLGDTAKTGVPTALGQSKSPSQKAIDKELLDKKLHNSQQKASEVEGAEHDESLADHIAREGMKTPINISQHGFEDMKPFRSANRPVVYNGHHRLAVARHLNPNQFVGFNYL